ncbi:MAG: hypothetical protein LBI69_00980 [Puniceicoccales bacterium]|jgi:hypothetical protein|nr:hypothetical protein [Puniceicoccales bacterium]
MEIAMLNPSNDQKNFSPFNANCSSEPLVPPKQNSYSSMGEGPSNKPTPKYMVESGWGISCQIDFNSTFFLDPLENQKKWAECSSTHDTPVSADSPTTQSHNSPSDESVSNSLGHDTETSVWGMPCQQPFQQISSPDQLPHSPEEQTEESKCPLPSHPPEPADLSPPPNSFRQHPGLFKRGMPCQPQTHINEKKFNTLYAETLEKFNSQSEAPRKIVGQLIWQNEIGVQILAKTYTEKISESAKKIPEIMANLILKALNNIQNSEKLIVASEALSRMDSNFVKGIFHHMKIDENLGKVAYLLAIAPMSCGIKFLLILPPATQARLLVHMTPVKISEILCELCGGNSVQSFENNSRSAGMKNAIKVLSEIGAHNAALILTQMMVLNHLKCAVIILAEMPLLFRTKEAADILVAADIQVARTLLSAMCGDYQMGAAEIIQSMDIGNVALIFTAMVLANGVNNVIIILRIIGPEVVVSIFQKFLSLNQHEVAMKIFVKMDSKMMGNMLLVIEKAQKAQETQDNPAEILEIFKLLSLENAIHVFKNVCNFEGSGNPLAALILATVMNQAMAMEVLVALSIKSATEIIKFMFVDESYKTWVLKIAPALKKCDKGVKILNAAKIKVWNSKNLCDFSDPTI